ncbi:hypothetical protein PR048_016871 [Dryococelus australis]|uniref:Uncharacterized protein n=1 Tax=Dryococelus australis TaxID=614101 RepID=A0ABQ9H7Z9_9NEOP|nr:hypothetical protein PR048_016871 [Dryococelus australis]
MTYTKQRRHWFHPFNIERLLEGDFTTMTTDLREDEDKFCKYFRTSISFEEPALRREQVERSQAKKLQWEFPQHLWRCWSKVVFIVTVLSERGHPHPERALMRE